MDKKQLLTAISLMAAGFAPVGAQAAVDPFQQCLGLGTGEAECACSVALDDGTASVIRSFIDQYSDEAQNTACAALASTLEPPTNGNGEDRGTRQTIGGGVGGSGGSYN